MNFNERDDLKEENNNIQIRILTNNKENKDYLLTKQQCSLSSVLKELQDFEDKFIQFDDKDLDEWTFVQIFEYLKIRNGTEIPKIAYPLEGKNLEAILKTDNEINRATLEFFTKNKSLEHLSKLAHASNYLGIQSLLELSCALISNLIEDITYSSEKELEQRLNNLFEVNDKEDLKLKNFDQLKANDSNINKIFLKYNNS